MVILTKPTTFLKNTNNRAASSSTSIMLLMVQLLAIISSSIPVSYALDDSTTTTTTTTNRNSIRTKSSVTKSLDDDAAAVINAKNNKRRDLLKIYSDKLDCVSDIRKRDKSQQIHKDKYYLGVHAIRGFDAAFAEYNLTFAEYLTATAGQRFDPPIEFEMVPTGFQGLFDAVYNEEIDFFYANPGVYSCVGVEVGAQPLATIISHLDVRGHVHELDVFGGVMFTLADNDDINTIHDFKDKIIGAGALAMIMAGQLQFYEMEMAGMSYVMDPKQVVFTMNQFDVVDGVLNGDFDVGFVRTDQLERTKDSKGDPIDPDTFKIISPKVYVLDNGELFPFLHSTDIYPEWPVAALSHVPMDVAEEVQEALLALQAHATTGRMLQECIDNVNDEEYTYTSISECQLSVPTTRCDTTNELAKLAYQASVNGNLAGFRTSRSYFLVRTMHEAGGFMKKDERGDWYCTRSEELYDAVDCPAGHYKLSQDKFNESCNSIGLKCKDGYECYCKPCVKAFEVDVYEYTTREEQGLMLLDHKGCDKMSLCGSVEQTKIITFRIVDNKERDNAVVTVLMHLGQETKELNVRSVTNTPWTYEFDWSNDEVGVGIMEIHINNEQIPESPIRVQIIDRHCDIDYPGADKVSSAGGECVCSNSTIDFGGKCVSSTIVAVVVSIFVFLIIATIVCCFIRYRNRKNDKIWQVNVDELHFDDPVEVIGQGSFGVVLLAEYRGTRVAIKRAVNISHKTRNSTHSSKSPPHHNKTGSVISSSKDSYTGSNNDNTTHPASVEVISTQDSGVDDITNETMDVESPVIQEDNQSRDSGGCGGAISKKGSQGHNLGFLEEDFGKRSRWGWLFPWLRQDENQNRFKESILGESASISKKSITAHLLPWCNKQRRQREEFIQEMRVLARLRHPCITTVMGAVISSNHDPMLVMEYMEYGSLHDLLRNETLYLSGEIIVQIARDIAQGLRYLHSSKPPILHGDLKGRNILIDSRFRAKLCDFGLSTKYNNLITGTPYWLAPEYLRGQSVYTTMCDMYSVGIILFEIYARKNPYEGENFRDVLRGICNRRVNKRPDVPSVTPPKMADLMKKCWSADSSFRPQAKDLDMTLMDMSPQDAEPLEEDNNRNGKKTGDMLYELFPKHIADALKAGQKVEPENHDLVTVVFSDIVHFTDISREISPLKVSNMLDRLYLAFDQIARKHQVFKVETIGDAYMGVTNLENNMDDTHVKHIAEFAVDMINEARKILIDDEDPSKGYINIRVGFHSGPVVSNVIGSLNPRYGLFGDTVNTASRMESNSQANRILCSERAYKLLREQAPEFPTKKRGKISVKGKGEMDVFWVGDKNVTTRKMKDIEFDVKHVGFAKENSFDDVPIDT